MNALFYINMYSTRIERLTDRVPIPPIKIHTWKASLGLTGGRPLHQQGRRVDEADDGLLDSHPHRSTGEPR